MSPPPKHSNQPATLPAPIISVTYQPPILHTPLHPPPSQERYRFHVLLSNYETIVSEPDALTAVKWQVKSWTLPPLPITHPTHTAPR